jgi:hypothetical protein
MTDTVSLVNTITGALPGIIALIRANHEAAHPGVPPPTSEEVIAAFESAVAQTLAKDAAWKAAHPVDGNR